MTEGGVKILTSPIFWHSPALVKIICHLSIFAYIIRMGMKLFFASLAVIGAMALAFGWYFNTTQKRISILTENAAKLEGVVNTQQATISAMEEAAANTQLKYF